MSDRVDQGRRVAIIGLACRFPGAGDPAEFHDLTVAGHRMFRPTAGPRAGLLHAALLDDWSRPPAAIRRDRTLGQCRSWPPRPPPWPWRTPG